MFLLADDVDVALLAAAVVAELISLSVGALPVAISRSSLMVANDPSTDSFALAKSELEVAKEVFSASEQVKPVADVILVVRVVTVEFSGFEATMALISVTMVMISAQLAAAALVLVFPARLSTVVFAESRPAEFAERVLAEANKAAFDVEHEDIAFIPSSSACLQAEKFPLQLLSWAITNFWSLLILQPLIVVTRAVKLSLLQHEHASVPLSFII